MTTVLEQTVRVKGEQHKIEIDSADVKTHAHEALFDECTKRFGRGKFHIENSRYYWLTWNPDKKDYRYR